MGIRDNISRELKTIERDMQQAQDCSQWLIDDHAHDEATGGDVLRQKDESRLYDHANIKKRLQRLRRLRNKGATEVIDIKAASVRA